MNPIFIKRKTCLLRMKRHNELRINLMTNGNLGRERISFSFYHPLSISNKWSQCNIIDGNLFWFQNCFSEGQEEAKFFLSFNRSMALIKGQVRVRTVSIPCFEPNLDRCDNYQRPVMRFREKKSLRIEDEIEKHFYEPKDNRNNISLHDFDKRPC